MPCVTLKSWLHQETVNRLRRRISQLEAQEKKAHSQSNVASQVKSFANLGRAICKVVSTFDCVESLIAEDDRRHDLEDARTLGDEVHEEGEVPRMEQDILHNGYRELCRFIVPLRKLLAEADHEELAPVLSAAIVPWLVAAIPDLNPALDPDSRENRGIHHDDLGRLLCPVEFDWNDQSVRTAIREGDPNYPMTAGSWWTGLYPPGKFDPAHPEAHLFTNVLLLKYRVALSDPNHWDDQDGGFDYREFYNNIVEYFEFPPGPVARNEVARLLDWNVFGMTPRWSLYEEHQSQLSRETRETSSVALMRAARLARESDV
ncbi:hypothetical protein K438DRAFT_1763172 [Mycena galopus ATCC 62051]|nr:hypothetical protein K438DRAFT_1763172 [Mycena galopus ATCC 62051]